MSLMTYENIKSRTNLRWALIAIFLSITIISEFIAKGGLLYDLIPIVSTGALFVFALFHGAERYGIKNISIFFLITWIVSNFFEALSIRTGFPFGHYFYDKLIGPRILDVPIIIILGYFATGYASWMLAHVLVGQYYKILKDKWVFIVPLIATFIMVSWDLCMDPLSSTIDFLWVWKDGGPYYGVPLQNFFGWFLTVYIIFQLFALYISKYDMYFDEKVRTLWHKSYWYEAALVYFIQGLSQLLHPFTQTQHLDIFGSMALVTVFTMVFISLLSSIAISNEPELT